MNEQTPACDALLGLCFEGPVKALKENPGFFSDYESINGQTFNRDLAL